MLLIHPTGNRTCPPRAPNHLQVLRPRHRPASLPQRAKDDAPRRQVDARRQRGGGGEDLRGQRWRGRRLAGVGAELPMRRSCCSGAAGALIAGRGAKARALSPEHSPHPPAAPAGRRSGSRPPPRAAPPPLGRRGGRPRRQLAEASQHGAGEGSLRRRRPNDPRPISLWIMSLCRKAGSEGL
jgi:hypothetical protein